MIKDSEISLFDFLVSLADAVDLVSPAIENHHKRVAYAACSLGEELGLAPEARSELLLAGALHDMGALSLKDRLNTLHFEIGAGDRHAELGYLLLSTFRPLAKVAEIVRFHHVRWDGRETHGQVPLQSGILHLADRVSVLAGSRFEILGQAGAISAVIRGESGKMFGPCLVDAFLGLAAKEYFWLDLCSPSLGSILRQAVMSERIELGGEQLLELADFFRMIIDFRSRFTATHSAGVAGSAEELARLSGFSADGCRSIKVAGYLHDLGKLAVPAEILEKPARLKKEEIDVIRNHSYHTHRILRNIKMLREIADIAAFHHERLDGKGYPFHLTGRGLSRGCRIMAVADVFTALTEDRPYRKGLERASAVRILANMVEDSALDPDLVGNLEAHFDRVNRVRMIAQSEASRQYSEISRRFGSPAPPLP